MATIIIDCKSVITEIGAANDFHPRNMGDIGWRLAQWALHQTYGKDELVSSGPLHNGCAVCVHNEPGKSESLQQEWSSRGTFSNRPLKRDWPGGAFE